MYEWIPRRGNRTATYVIFGLLASSVILMVFTEAFTFSYRSVMQTVAVALLAAAVLFVTRYATKSFVYSALQNEDGTWDFCVSEIRRKSRITVCRIGFSQICETVMESEENKKELEARSKKKKRFNYCVDLAPARSMVLFVNENGEELVLRLSEDEELFAVLTGKRGL